MIKEGKFGSLEAFGLVVIFLVTKIFYTSPMAIINKLGSAAWYATLISCATSLAFFWLLLILMKRFPGRDLFQIFEAVAGKIAGRALILLFALYFLYYLAVSTREFFAILKVYSLPHTPNSVIILPMLVLVTIMVYTGLEGIARVAYIWFFPIIGGLVIILVLAIPEYDWNNLYPLFGYGLGETVITGVLRSSAYDEIIILAIMINAIHGPENFKKVGISALLLVGVLFSIILACNLAAFQYSVAGEHLSGMYKLSRIIYYSRFIQRIEAIFLFIWVFASIISLATALYFAVSAYCRVFSINNHRPLLFSVLFIAGALCFQPENIAELIQIHVVIIRQYSSLLIYMVPLLILGLALILGRKGEKARVKSP